MPRKNNILIGSLILILVSMFVSAATTNLQDATSTFGNDVDITNDLDIGGSVNSGTWEGNQVQDAYVTNALTISSSGSVDWTANNNYPASCASGEYIRSVGDTITCHDFNNVFDIGTVGATQLKGLTMIVDNSIQTPIIRDYAGGSLVQVDDDLEVLGDLDVTGTITTSTQNINGTLNSNTINEYTGDTVTVTSNLTVNNNLNVVGTLFADVISFTSAIISGNLDVTGTITQGGNNVLDTSDESNLNVSYALDSNTTNYWQGFSSPTEFTNVGTYTTTEYVGKNMSLSGDISANSITINNGVSEASTISNLYATNLSVVNAPVQCTGTNYFMTFTNMSSSVCTEFDNTGYALLNDSNTFTGSVQEFDYDGSSTLRVESINHDVYIGYDGHPSTSLTIRRNGFSPGHLRLQNQNPSAFSSNRIYFDYNNTDGTTNTWAGIASELTRRNADEETSRIWFFLNSLGEDFRVINMYGSTSDESEYVIDNEGLNDANTSITVHRDSFAFNDRTVGNEDALITKRIVVDGAMRRYQKVDEEGVAFYKNITLDDSDAEPQIINLRPEIASSLGTCGSGEEGIMKYYTSDNKFYGCNGTTWNELG